MRDVRKMHVWSESIELAGSVYRLTSTFPSRERYGLTSQLRSAAISVSSNIAEGAGRGSPREIARLLRMAIGSVCEIDSQLVVAVRLGLVDGSCPIFDEVNTLRRRLARLHDRIQLDG